MKSVAVNASKKYEVLVSSGILDEAGKYASPLISGKSAVVVSDDNVYPLYGERLTKSLENCGFEVKSFVFPHGEKSKCMGVYTSLLEFMFENRITRSDALFALGGGVTGDLAGFAAATYQRGIKFIQVPTTLLAMVDSSVGGKTAVNLEHGKNQAGCFYQPSLVLCDPETLKTLPQEEFLCGCAEVIKYSVLFSEEFFESLSETRVENQLENVITTCVSMKRDIVGCDEFDTGVRMLLNLGHTVGHAVEACSNFSILHGQAVAAGTAIVARAAAKRGCLSDADCKRIISLLKQYGLPTETEYSSDELYRAALSDKKLLSGAITLIVPERIGSCKLLKIPASELEAWISDGLAD